MNPSSMPDPRGSPAQDPSSNTIPPDMPPSQTASSETPLPRATSISTELPPSSYPIAIVPSMVSQKTTRINMTERIKVSAEIRDLDTQAMVLKVVEVDTLLHATKLVENAAGNILFQIKDRQSTDDAQLYVKDNNGERVLHAGQLDAGRAIAEFKNKAEGPRKGCDETLYITSMTKWLPDGAVWIKNKHNEENVALVHRDGYKYRVAIAGGVDVSLIVAICICFDFKALEEGYTKDGQGPSSGSDAQLTQTVLAVLGLFSN